VPPLATHPHRPASVGHRWNPAVAAGGPTDVCVCVHPFNCNTTRKQVLGKALKDLPRQQIVVATKVRQHGTACDNPCALLLA
jgi:hypothetical protein